MELKVIRKKKPSQRAMAIAKDLVKVIRGGLTKEAYDNGMNVSRYLEAADPTSQHPVGTRSDAFNRVLAACGIRTSSNPELGISASTLEDVVNHPVARHLAIEIFSRAYRRSIHGGSRVTVASGEGVPGTMINQWQYPGTPRGVPLQPAIPLAELIGQTTGINSNYYKPFYIQDVQKATARVSEAAEIPAVRISTTEHSITLTKFGRRLDVTYEALRRIPIDLMSIYVQRIAIKVETDKVDTVMGIIVNGDGNSGTSATSYNLTALDPATTANNLTVAAWLAFKMKFLNPFQMTHVLGQSTSVLKLLMLNTGSTNIPLVMMGGIPGSQIMSMTPINQTLAGGERYGWLASAPASKLVGIDRRFAVERVFEIGANIQESDRDVKQQINSLILSEVEGYDIMEGGNANQILNLAA